MRSLVTGGAGFIGSHLVDRLINDGHEVMVLDNLSTGDIANVNSQAKFTKGDICDKKDMADYGESIGPVDFVYHLAAQINLRKSFEDPGFDTEVNVIGSLNVMELAKKCNAKFIFASSGGAIYSPHVQTPWNVHDKVNPKSPYGMNKHLVEKYLKMLKLNYAILRLANVYGPRQNHKGEAGVISIFIHNILNNEDLTIFGSGEQKRDFIYVDDVVEAFLAVTNKEQESVYYRIRNVGTQKGTSINGIAQMVLDAMGSNKEIRHAKAIPGELKNSSLICGWNGWIPQISLKDGIEQTVKYFV